VARRSAPVSPASDSSPATRPTNISLGPVPVVVAFSEPATPPVARVRAVPMSAGASCSPSLRATARSRSRCNSRDQIDMVVLEDSWPWGALGKGVCDPTPYPPLCRACVATPVREVGARRRLMSPDRAARDRTPAASSEASSHRAPIRAAQLVAARRPGLLGEEARGSSRGDGTRPNPDPLRPRAARALRSAGRGHARAAHLAIGTAGVAMGRIAGADERAGMISRAAGTGF
jgi:hypothetical protein